MQIHKVLPCLLLSLLIALPSVGEIYKWVDENGRTHYSDSKPKDGPAKEMKFITNTYKQVTVSDLPSSIVTDNKKTKKVVMYSTVWCGVCKKAKRYFEDNNIAYREYDIDKSEKARKRWEKLGGRGVPLILVGRKKMSGFSIARFEQLYTPQ